MKSLNPFLALVLAAACTSAMAQMPPGPMSFADDSGSVLTLNNPGPTTSGSYLDNVGLGGCPKGQTYQIANITTAGAPNKNGSIQFKTTLCNKSAWNFTGVILPPTGPANPMPTIQSTWTLTVNGASKYTAQPPQGMPGMPPATR